MRRYAILLVTLTSISVSVPSGGATEAAGGRTFDRIVGFGDSLSDPGNFFALLGLNVVAPFDPVPAAPYAIGDNRFSNGPTWLEQLAKRMRNELSAEPAFSGAPGHWNFAFGGARARSFATVPDLSTQVASFLARNGNRSLENSLIVIWIGTNDVRDALNSLASATSPDEIEAALAIIPDALASLQANILAMAPHGARTILVPNLPDLGITPAVRSLGPKAAATATALSESFNSQLDRVLDDLEVSAPKLEFIRLDIARLLADLINRPAPYGLEDTVAPCLSFGVIVDAVCDAPEDHLFWDAIHPTMAAHEVLADAAFLLLRCTRAQLRAGGACGVARAVDTASAGS